MTYGSWLMNEFGRALHEHCNYSFRLYPTTVEVENIRFNTFSLYSHIRPTLGPGPPIQKKIFFYYIAFLYILPPDEAP